jgi:hypothetical protein
VASSPREEFFVVLIVVSEIFTTEPLPVEKTPFEPSAEVLILLPLIVILLPASATKAAFNP